MSCAEALVNAVLILIVRSIPAQKMLPIIDFLHKKTLGLALIDTPIAFADQGNGKKQG